MTAKQSMMLVLALLLFMLAGAGIVMGSWFVFRAAARPPVAIYCDSPDACTNLPQDISAAGPPLIFYPAMEDPKEKK